MKQLVFILSVFALSACDRFQNDRWESPFQQINMSVSGGESEEGTSNPFGGAFGDDFNYNVGSTKQYWGEDGANSNSHYNQYHVGGATQYYRGTNEHGVYGGSEDRGY